MNYTDLLSDLFGIKLSKRSELKTSSEKCVCTPPTPLKTYKKVADNTEYIIKGEKIFSEWHEHGVSEYGLEIYILADSKKYLLYTERYDEGFIKIFDTIEELKIRLKELADGSGFLSYCPEYFRAKFKRALKAKNLYTIKTTELS